MFIIFIFLKYMFQLMWFCRRGLSSCGVSWTTHRLWPSLTQGQKIPSTGMRSFPTPKHSSSRCEVLFLFLFSFSIIVIFSHYDFVRVFVLYREATNQHSIPKVIVGEFKLLISDFTRDYSPKGKFKIGNSWSHAWMNQTSYKTESQNLNRKPESWRRMREKNQMQHRVSCQVGITWRGMQPLCPDWSWASLHRVSSHL